MTSGVSPYFVAGREYSHLLATCYPADLLEREVELLGVSHTDAGAFLLQHWDLPSALVEVARGHHCLPLDRPRLVELVSSGCHIADAIGFALTTNPPDDHTADEMLSHLVTDQDAFCFQICDGINQIECL